MAYWFAILIASWGFGQTPAQWTIVREFQIGSVDDSIYALSGSMAQLTVGPDGSIYVPQGQEIRIFDPEGRFLRAFGRSGEGPGEFRDMSYVSWCGDTLFAGDQRLQRIVLFNAAGELLSMRSWTAPTLPPPLGRSVPVAVLSSGAVVFRPSHALVTLANNAPRPIPVLRTDWSGTVLDTLAQLPPPSALVFRKGNRMDVTTQPFERTPILEVQPGGGRVFVIDFPESRDQRSDPVRATVFGADGRRLYSRTYAAPATRISKRTADSVYAAAAESLVRPGFMTLREAEKAVREKMTIPATYPPVTAAVAASDGSLWLGLRARSDGTRIWWVISREGNITAQLRTPSGVQVRAVQGSTVWAAERDELDVPYITKYRVVTGSSRGSRS